ncbi:D-2-hydroxyacid dehydrogenase family protein [Mycolicibacterium aichiense]|uniref:2-hydroxyacid dehydrogenase n=1 Tax=Mycolicibacterium aichiense TaxID=1799 RepID=A0AAD1MC08_9MYCO|nr:D-2-hydroxyacid dehydrogenase family protein [Mycolicibacterium aichiense]MCV7019811.1 D-2-hydroxyacid dehydrogenase family protein [Mycolicibacterium aichiense]BBX06814.1 2-hydroxyacid dehydrogenase [Mycolicibacterium aichiense]STZ80629.1 D-3-phosphoglycerate dehydrogenase SerA2 [Mycolicibacterium aichiense]
MTVDTARVQVAVLDDYQNVALTMTDWSAVSGRADITVFNDHVSDPDELVARLAPFDVIFVMRERTPLPRSIIERLPNLKMIASTGPFNASIDMAAVDDHGIHVGTTGGTVASTVELTWALILAGARNLVTEARSVRDGGWQTGVGRELSGRVLGVLGLGRIGARVARIGEAFGMDVIAWSENLTPEAAAEAGATYVGKDELFSRSDVLTIHMKLSERSTGLVGAAELAQMKPTALLVNTSRGPIVDEAALVHALGSTTITAALDVFDTEPLPDGHPLRTLDNVIATPHIGYVADRPYRIFFRDAVAAIGEWLDRNQ